MKYVGRVFQDIGDEPWVVVCQDDFYVFYFAYPALNGYHMVPIQYLSRYYFEREFDNVDTE